MRESIELESAKFMEELDHLRDTQGHLVEEVEHVYTEKVNVKTTQTKELRTKELKRVNFAHVKETGHLCDKTATMERDFTGRTVCMERQVDERREVENLNAYLRDIAKVTVDLKPKHLHPFIVEDLKAVQVGMKSQHDLIKDTFTQMQNRHEHVLHQFEENCQNSTKDLVKMIQEENQRMCRLREDLGLCDDLENMWRERVKDDLLGEVEEGLLTTGIRFQLEETITALYATVSLVKLA
ncbi:unnamed protein product [Hydatigera taeniaeformis]|uniref:t-SNARE coiled-coil homology domain-containing protein n=1 Tax=Hydatigena taeniaeformis TaxID=6205 RepID=A0A0R3WIG0_HYDTA|nr:unnamed protein product [Hydatigera taeniaeformis]